MSTEIWRRLFPLKVSELKLIFSCVDRIEGSIPSPRTTLKESDLGGSTSSWRMNGNIMGTLFPDVPACLRRWPELDISGSSIPRHLSQPVPFCWKHLARY